MEKSFFSIIMPAYNAEPYLHEAITSILSQSFTNFELIVVNDGSHDHTLDICKSFAKNDNRLKLIDKKNEGVAVARNTALDIAKGNYVMFVDSDDIVYPDALQLLYDSLQQDDYDYLRFEYKTIDSQGRDLYTNYEAKKRKGYIGKILDSSSCITKLVRGEFFSCVGVFKRSIIERHHLRLMGGCTYNEDTLFMMEYFMYSKSHSYIGDVLYGYRKTDSAVTAHFTDKNYRDVLSVAKRLISLQQVPHGISQQVSKLVIEMLCLNLVKSRKCELYHEAVEVFNFCLLSPLTLEWKLLKLLGFNKGLCAISVVNFWRKVIRRFN